MERTISVEEKIRRAEEIYERRHRGDVRPTVKISNDGKKDIKLFKKLILQVLACLLIYLIIYTLQNNDNLFSHDFINKARDILSYDTDFVQMYNNVKNSLLNFFGSNLQDENMDENIDENIGGSDEENINDGSSQDAVNVENTENTAGNENSESSENAVSSENSDNTELTEEEKMIQEIKNTTSFIKPVEGTISSEYGQRETTISTVPKNHTGTDIAANLGTKIVSATDGEVVLASSEGDYR